MHTDKQATVHGTVPSVPKIVSTVLDRREPGWEKDCTLCGAAPRPTVAHRVLTNCSLRLTHHLQRLLCSSADTATCRSLLRRRLTLILLPEKIWSSSFRFSRVLSAALSFRPAIPCCTVGPQLPRSFHFPWHALFFLAKLHGHCRPAGFQCQLPNRKIEKKKTMHLSRTVHY